MAVKLRVNDKFPDFELPDHTGQSRRLSSFIRPSTLDDYLGFEDGYPVILVFYRGFFCPRDQQQMRWLVEFQAEIAVNYAGLVTVGVQPPMVQAAFRAGLGATFPFLCDTSRKLIKQLNILDETEGEYANTAQPFTFVLRPDLTIYRMYNGWFFVGRPTLEELRRDLRAIMETLSHYSYDAWNTSEVKRIRIPQAEWLNGGDNLLDTTGMIATGVVASFDRRGGNGYIRMDGSDERIFFNFTAIPGEGYRAIGQDIRVQFEVIENATGRTARNIRSLED
jgi:peroxiredoxin/cold shock CspA family protein